MESQRLTHRTVKNKEETICKKSENPGNLTGMSQKRGKMYSSQEWQITNVKD